MTNIKPQTYNQSQHGISTDEISPSAQAIIFKLIEHGYNAYIVGGAVRDLLLEKHPKDFDIATNATPEQIKDVFGRECRLIGRRFRLAHVYHNREMYEVATFRGTTEGEREVKNGHIIKDNVFGSIDQDAMRRDFTCNALYLDIENGNVLDFCQGVKDIREQQLHFIGEAHTRIIEDPIRMIRAIRFQAKLGLIISEEIIQAIHKHHATLSNVSTARLFDELIKLFHCGQASVAYRLMNELMIFEHIFPYAIKAIEENENNKIFIVNALKSTDFRIKSGKSVTPIFLFSCILWPLAVNKTQKHLNRGLPIYEALNRAANEVFEVSRKTLLIPKMIQIGIRNIWQLQYRFLKNKGKKVFFTLDHPRFRAAYDFLLLRAHESDEIKELGQWWTKIQTLSKTKQKELIFPQNNKNNHRNKNKKKTES